MITRKQLNNYKMVDIMKYIAAIMVICIHCTTLFDYEYLNFFIKNILCRIAVPFFFISSAYFIRKNAQKDSAYVKQNLKKTFKSYMLWSLIFLPIGLDWIHQNLTLAGNLLPLALIVGILYIGTYYHLWYIPALLFSVYVVDKLLKYLSYKKLFIISTLLFIFGSLETYYGFLPNGWLKEFFDGIINVFFTTRSGLLFAMIFIVMGFFIYDYQEKIKSFIKQISPLTLLFGILLILEGAFLYSVPRLDMNFMITLIPFTFFFFLWILSCPRMVKFHTEKIRELSKYYYFVHPISIVLVEELGQAFHFDIISSGIFSLLLIILFTHILSSAIIYIHKQTLKPFLVFLAGFLGIMILFVLGALFFQFKEKNILVKFEWIPCLWVYVSFCIYYLLLKIKKDPVQMTIS